MTPDVVVVGGGLAGAAAAIGLRQRGLTVVVVEKAALPRDKPCGEGLLPHGVAKLGALGLDDVVARVEGQPFRGILYRCHGAVAVGDFAAGAVGYGVQRRRLDALVHEAARAAGADVVAAAVVGLELSRDDVTVALHDGRRVTARLLVGADGPRSVVRHALGLDAGPPRRGRYAVRRHFALAPGTPLPDRVEVTVAAGHELYVTPVAPGVVGVAALVERAVMQAGRGAVGERLTALLSSSPAAARERLAGATPLDDALACGPLRVRARAVHRGRALLIGDAAGYVDAITGEGMSLALATADLAGTAAAEALATGDVDAALRRYAKARARAFFDHAVLTHGLVFLARHEGLARRAVSRLAKEPALFTRLLEVNNGTRSVASLGLLDALKLAVGSRPPGALAG